MQAGPCWGLVPGPITIKCVYAHVRYAIIIYIDVELKVSTAEMGAEPAREMEVGASPPQAWELAGLEESIGKLMLQGREVEAQEEKARGSSPDGGGDLAEAINQVDQFLRDALQNPRERLTILRMEQQVENFIQNPSQQQLDFEQLPTSYLRLVAHRVAQHYGLQSMVVIDCHATDGSGSRIIARKTPQSGYPVIRLADIPVNLPRDEKTNVVRFEIMQRSEKGSQVGGRGSLNNSSDSNFAKSVEERKEEYIKARARIFNSNSSADFIETSVEDELASFDNEQCYSIRISSPEGKLTTYPLQNNDAKALVDCSSGLGGTNNLNGQMESPPGRVNSNNIRVAIFRDREKDRKDPDYDRSYDRYNQRFDPGFGLNLGPFSMPALYTPLVNYNTEFPQLGTPHRAQIHMEPPPPPVPPHVHGTWGLAPPNTMGYGPPDAMVRQFHPGHLGAHSSPAMYLQSSQFACPGPAMSYIHLHEQFQQPLARPYLQQQPESSFAQARRR